MKQIHSMTEEEYNSLKASGMFWEIFPEATGDYIADATQSAMYSIESTVEQEMRDVGYTEEDLKQAKEFGEKFEALRKTQPCCGQGGCGDCDVDFDEPTTLQMGDVPSLITRNTLTGVGFNEDSVLNTPTPVTVMYDATSLRMAVEWVYEHNHHIVMKYPSVNHYEKSIMLTIAKFVRRAEECECASSTSTGGLMINACWTGHHTIQLDFTVDPSVGSNRYSHYVEMEVDGLIDFIESFAED